MGSMPQDRCRNQPIRPMPDGDQSLFILISYSTPHNLYRWYLFSDTACRGLFFIKEVQIVIHVIEAKTISDAWFQIIHDLFDHAYRQDIQRGSFEKEQYRLQYPALAFSIEFPELDMVPYIPPQYGIPAPTSEEYIQDYFANYLMDPELGENETYKYSSRIHHPMPGNAKAGIPAGGTQLERVIEMLKTSPH